jgi:universal stress protein A
MAIYQHILVAIDFTESIDQVIDKALAMRQAFGARMSLVHVVEPVMFGLANETFIPQELDIDRKLVELAGKHLEDLAKQYGMEDAGRFVEEGSIRREILRTAEQQQVDLILVGSHGRSGVQALLGSTANAVLHGARCDVLAIRIRD